MRSLDDGMLGYRSVWKAIKNVAMHWPDARIGNPDNHFVAGESRYFICRATRNLGEAAASARTVYAFKLSNYTRPIRSDR